MFFVPVLEILPFSIIKFWQLASNRLNIGSHYDQKPTLSFLVGYKQKPLNNPSLASTANFPDHFLKLIF